MCFSHPGYLVLNVLHFYLPIISNTLCLHMHQSLVDHCLVKSVLNKYFIKPYNNET